MYPLYFSFPWISIPSQGGGDGYSALLSSWCNLFQICSNFWLDSASMIAGVPSARQVPWSRPILSCEGAYSVLKTTFVQECCLRIQASCPLSAYEFLVGVLANTSCSRVRVSAFKLPHALWPQPEYLAQSSMPVSSSSALTPPLVSPEGWQGS